MQISAQRLVSVIGAAAAAVMLFAGCESSSSSGSSGSSSGDLDLSKVSWIGPDFSGAVRDDRAVLHSIDISRGGNMIFLNWDPLPSDWPRQVNAPGMMCLFYKQGDGTWRGGKFEWLDPGQTAKSLKNISNGYNGWRTPPAGSKAALIIFSTDGARRSNAAYGTY